MGSQVTITVAAAGRLGVGGDPGVDRREERHQDHHQTEQGAPLAVVAASAAALGCYRGIADRDPPHRATLLVVAGVAAVLSGVNLLAEPSSEVGPTFHVGSAVVSCALGLIAVGRPSASRPASPGSDSWSTA